jgi:hypothetical protein
VIEEYRKRAKTMPGGKVSILTLPVRKMSCAVVNHCHATSCINFKYPDLNDLSILQAVILTDQDILEMIFFPVVNEACRVMEENVVIRAPDLDIASVLGMGFPKYRCITS